MLKSFKNHWFSILVIIGISVGMTVYGTWCGLGLTYDSFDYLAASESFRESYKLTNHNGTDFVFHAPLFPVILSFFGEKGEVGLKLLNWITCLFTLTLIFLTTRKYIQNKTLYVLAFLSISVSAGFQMIHCFLWTEPFFLLFFIVHNYLLLRFLEGENKVDFWLLIISAFFLGITRNAGFFIILITTVIIWYYSNRDGLKNSFLYIFLGSIGFALWNLTIFFLKDGKDIYLIGGFLHGFSINVFNYTDIISQWFLPAFLPYYYRMAILVFCGIVFLFYANKWKHSRKAIILFYQFLAYVLIMMVVIQVDKDEIERLLAIIAPWLIIAAFIEMDINWEGIRTTLRKIIILSLLVWVSYVSLRGAYNIYRWHNRNCQTESISNY